MSRQHVLPTCLKKHVFKLQVDVDEAQGGM